MKTGKMTALAAVLAAALLLGTSASAEECAPQPAVETGEQILSAASETDSIEGQLRALNPDTSWCPPDGDSGGGSLAAIALAEAESDGSTEFPLRSGNVKYNTWLYGRRVCNRFENGTYLPQYGWNTVFVSWCAAQARLTDAGIFPETASGGELYSVLTERGAKTVTKTELLSGQIMPQKDDIIFFPTGADYICGIVTECSNGTVSYAAGDVNGRVACLTAEISGLQDSVMLVQWKGENDALVPYIMFLEDELGLNAAASIGILANMRWESGFNCHALGDGGTSYGLCQWHNGRWLELVRYSETSGSDWQTATGQLLFLKWELEQRYPALLYGLRRIPENSQGAYDAAFLFCLEFERPSGGEESAASRGETAAAMYPASARITAR